MRSLPGLVALVVAVRLLTWPEAVRTADDRLSPGRASLLHAHNCYPDEGRWPERLDRALATGLSPIAIEQDLVWAPDRDGGRSVVSHGGPLTGQEPTLEEHFFRRVAPLMNEALQRDARQSWPLLVLHLDFKTNEFEHHLAIWEMLGRYESWLTVAERPQNPAVRTSFVNGPLLVLTENGDGQTQSFYERVPAGDRLRLFGTVASTAAVPVPAHDSDAARPLSYRRWVNLSWAIVEGMRQPAADPWNEAKRRRLEALVATAHDAGWWIRFYTLNGHPADEDRGWSGDYNFGSLAEVQDRWRAAIDARVDFIATDQYEELTKELDAARGNSR